MSMSILDGNSGMLSGSLTPPDKVNGEHHHPQQPGQQHWGTPSPLGLANMAGPMQTPPSSPPMQIERFGYVTSI